MPFNFIISHVDKISITYYRNKVLKIWYLPSFYFFLRKILLFFNFQKSIGLPDVHSGYGFAIGNTAAFDMADPKAIVSPGLCLLFSLCYCNKNVICTSF